MKPDIATLRQQYAPHTHDLGRYQIGFYDLPGVVMASVIGTRQDTTTVTRRTFAGFLVSECGIDEDQAALVSLDVIRLRDDDRLNEAWDVLEQLFAGGCEVKTISRLFGVSSTCVNCHRDNGGVAYLLDPPGDDDPYTFAVQNGALCAGCVLQFATDGTAEATEEEAYVHVVTA